MTEKVDRNPFSVSGVSPVEPGIFADHVHLRRRAFLFRVLDIEHPFLGRLVYSGWWFRQMVEINGIIHWFQISWLSIRPTFEFALDDSIELDPTWSGRDVDPTATRRMTFEIQFSPGLRIRRFRIALAGRMLYDEIV